MRQYYRRLDERRQTLEKRLEFSLIKEMEKWIYVRFGPEDEDFSNHPEQVLSIRVGTCQPSCPLSNKKNQIREDFSRMIILLKLIIKESCK